MSPIGRAQRLVEQAFPAAPVRTIYSYEQERLLLAPCVAGIYGVEIEFLAAGAEAAACEIGVTVTATGLDRTAFAKERRSTGPQDLSPVGTTARPEWIRRHVLEHWQRWLATFVQNWERDPDAWVKAAQCLLDQHDVCELRFVLEPRALEAVPLSAAIRSHSDSPWEFLIMALGFAPDLVLLLGSGATVDALRQLGEEARRRCGTQRI